MTLAMAVQNEPAGLSEIRMTVLPYLSKLADFGTAEEIREFLVSEEIVATLTASTCPIAEYVRHNSGQTLTVYKRGAATIHQDNMYHLFDNSEAMGEFIVKFDLRLYPELLKKELRA